MAIPTSSIARRILYRGRVQGVGFRYSVQTVCRRHSLAGWVRNLEDGRVEAWMEGRASDVDSAMQEIARIREGHITGVDQESQDAHGHTQFEIRR